MNILKFALIFFCFMGIPSIVHAAPLPYTTIRHDAIPSFTINERMVIDAEVTDSEGVIKARCYFKTDMDSSYLYVSMRKLSENNFQGFLPAFGPGVQSVDYFFLIVNGSGQIIRSTPYTASIAGSTLTPEKETAADSSEVLEVFSELAVTELEDTSIIDRRILLMATQHSNQLYGLRAGIYEETVIPDSFGVMPGFFGGFILNPADNTVEPVKGFAPNMKPLIMERSSAATILSEDAGTETTPEPVNIAGDDWIGFFYRSDSSYQLSLTASISQNDSRVTITTTKSGLGNHLAGTINTYGDMLLYDNYDGEDWTTHYGPARSTKVKIYDYAWPFELGEPIPPLNAIILYRPPLPPTGVAASDGTFPDKVAVNWDLSSGAGSYLVYGCSSISADDCLFLADIATNHYEDTRETEGIVHYRVRACDDLCSEYSDYDTGFLAKLMPLAPIFKLLL